MVIKAAKKSCGSQLLDSELPSHDWDIDRLGQYAKLQYDTILTTERTLAPYYWRLGHGLSIARKAARLNHGQWGQFLASLGIDKSRASKARAIFRAFSSPEEVENLSVEEAYQARHRKKDEENASAVDEQAVQAVKAGQAMVQAEKAAALVAENVAQLTKAEKQGLLKNLEHTIVRLEALRRQLVAELGEQDSTSPA